MCVRCELGDNKVQVIESRDTFTPPRSLLDAEGDLWTTVNSVARCMSLLGAKTEAMKTTQACERISSRVAQAVEQCLSTGYVSPKRAQVLTDELENLNRRAEVVSSYLESTAEKRKAVK